MALDGNWKLSLQTPMGTREVDLELVTSGTDLSGAFKAPQGTSSVTGTVNGAAVNFTTMFNGAMGPMQLTFEGNHEGDQISGTVQFGAFGSGPFTATRV